MNYASDEVRHTFHQLPTADQLRIHGIWTLVSKQGLFLTVDSAKEDGSEIILRISKKFIPDMTRARHFSDD
jgi:hypothetical protein